MDARYSSSGVSGGAQKLQPSRSRSSFRDGNAEVVDVDNRQATLVRLFLSGKNSAGISTSSTFHHLPQGDEQQASLSERFGGEVEYFPEPPCIAPIDENETDYPREVMAARDLTQPAAAPQHYWKNQTTWRHDDPDVEVWIQQVARFRESWDKLTDAIGSKASAGGRMHRKHHRPSTNAEGEDINIQAFVNVSSFTLGVRTSPAQDSEKTGEIVAPGEPVVIERVQEMDGVRFLKVADRQGWLFDSRDNLVLMSKMEDLEVGTAWYRVVCRELVEVRSAPVYDAAAKTSRLLCPKEIVAVNMKCRVRGALFCHLADGRGWVFLLKKGASRTSTHSSHVILEECEAEFDEDANFDPISLLPATTDAVEVGSWNYVVGMKPVLALGTMPHGTHLSPGEVVLVNKRAFSHGDTPCLGIYHQHWLRLNDGRGWVPERGMDGKVLLELQQDNALTYPKHFRGKLKDLDVPKHEWMMGVA